MNMNNKLKPNKGFTLVEIMVATSIFMIVMLIAIGSLMTASDDAKKSQALQSAMDNVNFAMDSMTRSLRMGTNYSCITEDDVFLPQALPIIKGNDCDFEKGGGGGIAFTPADTAKFGNGNTAYAVFTRDDGTKTSTLRRCDLNATECTDLVANNVDIQTLKFFVNGSNPNGVQDNIQPSVYIIMKGIITVKDQSIPFAIQTMASQRTTEQ
jgi:prepilin-type N-terminal cleavage/methylation domain-containing protein